MQNSLSYERFRTQTRFETEAQVIRKWPFYFLGTSTFNSLPLSLRNINSRVLFKKALDAYYLSIVVSVVVFNGF